jgi:hypothetical protein
VTGEVLETQSKIGEPLRQGSRFGQGASIHRQEDRLILYSDPVGDLGRPPWLFLKRALPD